jgi:hypothetical protein
LTSIEFLVLLVTTTAFGAEQLKKNMVINTIRDFNRFFIK